MAVTGRRALAWTLFILTLTLMGSPATAEELRYRLTDTTAALRSTTDDGYQVLRLDGGAVLQEPGRPEIPVRRLEFVIPDGLVVLGVHLESGAGVQVANTSDLRVTGDWISSRSTRTGYLARGICVGDRRSVPPRVPPRERRGSPAPG